MEALRRPGLPDSFLVRRMTISPARRAAFEILRRVETESAFASVLLAELDRAMRDDDRSLCHELVLGVLRRRLWLDRAIEHLAGRRIESLDLAVRLALQLGLYQLRFLSRIPPSAAVNESVNLMSTARVKSAKSFVNAVLRRAARESDYDPAANVSDPLEKVAVETSHPRWLIERWTNAMGLEEATAFALANNQPAPTAFRLTARSASSEDMRTEIFRELNDAGAIIQPSKVVRESWRVEGALRVVRKLAAAGLIYLQDEASQLVAAIVAPKANQRVLDLTGAPGSKATHMAMIAPHATIIAGDLYSHRANTMRTLALNQDALIWTVVHDARRKLPYRERSFDRVLLDAPCSGTGTLRRNPEIRWRLQPGDIAELSGQQQQMLFSSAEMVRAGGHFVYSTCSVELEENEAVVEAFLASNKDFVRIVSDVSTALRSESGAVRTWPHREGVDGFFITALERRS
jgi:16S rRNA (cytosine967-C5)-methyltransferase